MSSPLEPIWDAYTTAAHALKVTRRCATLSRIDPERPFRNTRFHRIASPDVQSWLGAAQRQLDAQTVLSLYATFEAALREDITARGDLLLVAVHPDALFGQRLKEWFEGLCDDARMDRVVELYEPVVGAALVGQVASTRVYRHWLAHGRRGSAPPLVTPQFAWHTLTDFLQLCGLT